MERQTEELMSTKTELCNPEQVYLIKQFDSWFKIWWICLTIGFVLSIFLIGIPILIVAHIFCLIIIYNLWKLIPENVRATSPGRAVGFTFIPLFNIYWYFVAFYKLSKSINVELKNRQIMTIKVDEGFVLTMCVLFIFHFVPYINILTSLASIPFLIISMKQMKDAGKAIVSHDHGLEQEPNGI